MIEGTASCGERARRCAVSAAALAAFIAIANPVSLLAQEPGPAVTPYFINVTRVESWSFFEPHRDGGDPTYTLFGNRATLGVRVLSRRFEFDGAFEYGQVLNLPQRSVGRGVLGPGVLGPGAQYHEAARSQSAYQLYFRTLWARMKDVLPGASLTGGRMSHASGGDHPRLSGRMIGDFEWSMFRRAFDGVRLDVARARWSATGSLLFPTQGGFEESANPTISKLRLIAVEGSLDGAALAPPVAAALASPASHASSLRVFGYHYHDRRDIPGRPDNTGLPANAVDISLATFGAAHTGSYHRGRGRLDSVAWIAAQTGDWYGDAHRAFSVVLEGGYQWGSNWMPWLRAGWLYASGDDDPGDFSHRTFFPMVPSSQRYVRSMTYAHMNVRDGFVSLQLTPREAVRVQADVHRVSLASEADRWYTGSGATAREGNYFGYSSRLSFGETGLGTMVETSLDVEMSRRWSMTGYIGLMNGGPVIERGFAGDRLTFFYVQNVLRF